MYKIFYILASFLLPQLVSSQTADFSIQSNGTVLCTPSTINFSQKCTGNPIGFVWDFGNNTKAYSPDATTTYATAGAYIVKLIAIYDQTTVEISKTIKVNPSVSVGVGVDRNYICTPGGINFSASTTAGKPTFDWSFGDATGSIISVGKDTAHSYTKFGNFQVALKVTDTTGCFGIANTDIAVSKPTITATAVPSSGCIPVSATFSASANLPTTDFITNYAWTFGDGSPISSTVSSNITHLYATVGTYLPTLVITTKEGCTNNINLPAVAYGTPPINHVAYPKKAIVCGSETPLFVSKAINATNYVWDFGDGTVVSVTDTFAQHKYATLGTKSIVVTPYFNGCAGSTISFTIDVVGVISSFNYVNTCADKKTYTFTNTSQGSITSNSWTFGDTSLSVSTINATHLFPRFGEFVTTLLVKDSITGCIDASAFTIYTADPILVNADTFVCRNSTTNFSIANNYSLSHALYSWNVAGQIIGPVSGSAISVKAGTLGTAINFVTIYYDAQSCPDTIYLNHPLIIRGPDLNFSAPDTSCFNSLFNITNLSKPFIPKDSVVLWQWDYGNSVLNDTIYQPLPFKYRSEGIYNIKLTARDINGCVDSLSRSVIVAGYPFLKVTPRLDTLCLGQSTVLKAFSSTNLSWSPVTNLTCNNCDSVTANPSVTTKYFITATNTYNCNIRDSILVKVYAPFTTNILPGTDVYICKNDQLQLDVTPKINRVTWSPAAGLSGTTIYNPIAAPSQTTTYTVTQTDSAGCFNSSSNIQVFVKSLPTVNAGTDQTVPYNTSFTISPSYSSNVKNYLWTPTTLLSCTDCVTTTGTALYAETFTIKVTSDSGCVATDDITIFVQCKNANILLPKAFSPNGDNLNDLYYPITRGIKTILKFVVFNRQGNILYQAGNFPPNTRSFSWNGQFKGQVQPAAGYVYLVEALCDQGEKLVQSGSFILVR